MESGRRRFLTGAFGAAGGLWALPDLLLPGGRAAKRSASDVVTLGQTGIKVSRLALGTGTQGVNHTSQQGRLGTGGLADLLCHGFEQGLRFWETADQYGTHEHLREGLRRVGRDNVVVLTKSHAETSVEMELDLQRFCRELGRDHIDVILLHCMRSATWPKEREGAMEVLSRAREKGIIRAHGVSCHSIDALRVAARTPWVQVDLARINPAQAAMDADPETVLGVLREMKAAGKAVIGMKILGGGRLRADVDRAIRFASGLDCLDAFTIGFGSRQELDDVAGKIA